MQAVFLTRYGTMGASSRYRFYQFESEFSANDISCKFLPLFENSVLESKYNSGSRTFIQSNWSIAKRFAALPELSKADVVILQGEAIPYAPAIIERVLKVLKVPYIVDFDDAIFHYYDKSRNWFIRNLLKNKIPFVVRNSACVVAGNDYLANFARSSGANRVEIVPTVVNLDKYPPTTGEKIHNQDFRIGWIGSPSTCKYLKLIAPALETLANDHECKIVLIGASADHGLGSIEPEILPWSDETEVKNMHSFDVGIMPLPDNPWARGKCGFKLIQYMACNKPVVASPVGANCEIVQDMLNGFLADSNEQWIRSILQLKTNRDLATQMGVAGRRIVESTYSTQAAGPILAKIIRSVARQGK